MTLDTIERVKALVDEVKGTSGHVVSVWKYMNTMSEKYMFAVFTTACYCDVFESPAVLNPVLIFRSGKFIGEYKFMNKVR